MHALFVLVNCLGDADDVGGECVRPVVTVVGTAGGLVLTAHVDRGHPAASRRERL